MKKIIFLAGITASGKTTYANKMSEKLSIPFISVDGVYQRIADELGYKEARKLVLPENWNIYKNFKELKKKYYKELISKVEGDFIMEGFPLFFQEDIDIIFSLVEKDIWTTYFYINLNFKTWLKLANKKYNNKPIKEKDFKTMNNRFQKPIKPYYTIRHLDSLLAHYEVYQREGFTDIKWNKLQIKNEDIKNKTILDIGCNDGWIGDYCLKKGAKSVDGIEYNWRYAEIARQKGTKIHFFDLNTINTWHRVQEKKKYDVIFCLAVLHYCINKEFILKSLSEITGEVLILEIPISQQKGKTVELFIRGAAKYYVLTQDLLEEILNKYFSKVVLIGESIPPDNSKRLIYKCYVDSKNNS